MKSLALSSVALRSIRFFLKTHTSVCLGIAAATAVIVGALVVGDSVRESLRDLVLNRLANIECLLHSRTFFEPQLFANVSVAPAATGSYAQVVPLIYLPGGSVEHRDGTQVHRSSQVQVLGVQDDFWSKISVNQAVLPTSLGEDEIAIGNSLANELMAQVGDELTLHFNSVGGVPADNPLGRRDDSSLNLPRQKIVAILPDEGVGGLSFQSSQTVPRNVFCATKTLQATLQCGTQVNAAVILNQQATSQVTAVGQAWCDEVNTQLEPKLEDYGLTLERVTLRFPPGKEPATTSGEGSPSAETIYDYFQLSSTDLLIDDQTANAVTLQFEGQAIRQLSYLANRITKIELGPTAGVPEPPSGSRSRRGSGRISSNSEPVVLKSRSVPYSILVGTEGAIERKLEAYDAVPPEILRYPYCWINSWLAEQLQASPQDWLEVKYFEPETVDGNEQEQSTRFIIAGVVPLTEPERGFRRNRPPQYSTPPTFFNDPHMTPTVPGLTDKDSIANWDAPFKLDLDLIKPVDDEYYDHHRLTPKLFVPYLTAASSRLFRSRFGQVTSIRFPAESFPNETQLRRQIEAALLNTRVEKGIYFLAVRDKLLQSATGTTPFDMLFLSLSMFVIIAALMLVALLFKLGIQRRAGQLGLLAAIGFTSGRIRGLLIREFFVVALAGSIIGIVLGLGYAWAMIAALESWWLGAISTPFLGFHFAWHSLLIGAVAGLLMSLTTIYFSLRTLTRLPPLQLLRDQIEPETVGSHNFHRGVVAVACFIAMGALALVLAGIGQTGMARAGSFFGSGMLLLFAALIGIHQWLRVRTKFGNHNLHLTSLAALAGSTIHRNPLRSSLAIALLSVASFLIASMSVFHIAPNSRGYGGFDLLGESSQPIYRNIGSRTVRTEVLGQEAEKLDDILIVPMRRKPGEDASCNNLLQVAQPTILGIPPRLSLLKDFDADAGSFDWAASALPASPWKALERFALGDATSPIPVILDQNTAAWSLKQGASLGSKLVLKYGERTLHFQTVGLLSNSVLQGKLMISQANFQLMFPEISGNSFFLIRTGENRSEAAVTEALEKGWSDEGLDITSSRETLARMLGVQNTYISAFQSLGALGLLLGTFGLIAVQLRSVLERRRELALMQAVGFSRARITRMLSMETGILLGGGLLVGSLAAAIALVPYIIENSTSVSVLQPLGMLAVILIVGFIAALLAVHSAMKKSVLDGLRSE